MGTVRLSLSLMGKDSMASAITVAILAPKKIRRIG